MNLFLVRHAHAGDRHRWDTDQDRRPLSDRGHEQAAALASLLDHHRITGIVSSPTTRCEQTVAPLAAALDLAAATSPALYEGSGPAGALTIVDEHSSGDLVLCSHGDVIPELLRALRHRGLETSGMGACEKGSTWEIAIDDGTVRGSRYHPAPIAAASSDPTARTAPRT